MAYQLELADRIRELLNTTLPIEEKEMFQGLCFLVDDKMCICTREDHLLCRIGETQVLIEVENGNCRQMIMNGRTMKDFVWVDIDSRINNRDLARWVNLCMAFNPEAKSSKKKPTARKQATKKSAVKRTINAKKTAVKKAARADKKASARKTPVKKSSARKSPAKKKKK